MTSPQTTVKPEKPPNPQNILALRAEELRLVAEEAWLVEALKTIKEQKMSLKVEQLQLSSMIRDAKAKRTQHTKIETKCEPAEDSKPVDTELLDAPHSSINTKELDLSTIDQLDSILSGNFYAESESDEDGFGF